MFQFAELPFKVEIPFECFHKAGAEQGQARRIGGVISTESKDRQGEIVLQRGLDFSEFVKNGWFNDNHSKETTGIVGYPLKVEKRSLHGRPVHYVEGYLLEGYEPADKIWKLAQSLQATGRRLGFSIEGSVTRRDGGQGEVIAQAKVRNVAITNCFPAGTLVLGAAEKVTRRTYAGPMVTIYLATGEKLTGTPNHPVFTQRGWVALGELNEVHDRVGCFRRDSVLSSVVPHDVDDVPSCIEEIFNLSLLAGSTSWVCPTREGQFHGDWKGGEIDVVPVYGLLQHRFHSAFQKKFGKNALSASDKKLSLLTDDGFGSHFFVASRPASSSLVSGCGKSLSFGGGSLSVAPKLFLVSRSGDTHSLSDVENTHPRDPIFGRDAGRALSSAIGFSHITRKHIGEFCGHVYNLESVHGWYEANGIIAHNCPVNTDTGLEILAKSILALEHEGEDLRRALMAGYGLVSNGSVAPGTAVPGMGYALRTQHMEAPPKKKKKRRLSKSEAIAWLCQRYRGLSEADAERVYQYAAARSV